jgi:uncharacterized cupredoxin-like copper-binding protein
MRLRAFTAALAALTAILAAAGCGGGGGKKVVSGGSGQSGGSGRTIQITETEYALAPSTVKIQKPGTYTLHVVNQGKMTHALGIEGSGLDQESDHISPGSSADVTVKLTKAGDYDLYCPIDGHKALGMKASLTVAG